MNLMLVESGESQADGTVTVTGRRAAHAFSVLQLEAGDSIAFGVRDGPLKQGAVIACTAEKLVLQSLSEQPPPPKLDLWLVLAMPRPKAFKRILASVASLGINHLALVNAARVEKSYFDSKVLDTAFVQSHLDLGLEQAKDTVSPTVRVFERLKPFVEDVLNTWSPAHAVKLLPHPKVETLPPVPPRETPLVVAIGPEGGWVPFEVELFERHHFRAVSFGPRVLRTEVAIPAIVGALRRSF
jgi:RsmE family RNA methyltransferase